MAGTVTTTEPGLIRAGDVFTIQGVWPREPLWRRVLIWMRLAKPKPKPLTVFRVVSSYEASHD